MARKLVSLFFMVLILTMMPISAFAQGLEYDRLGSVSVSLKEREAKPISGAELSLYRVAKVSINSAGNLSYNFTETFEDCGFELYDSDLSAKLDAYIEDNSLSGKKQTTDAEGNAVFNNLRLGLYFIKQTNSVDGFAPCSSFLVTVPGEGNEGYIYDINATPKTDVAKLCSITIKKVWNTDSYSKIASSVEVQLLRDDSVVETAVLNAQNNWQITYKDMPESDAYSIKEVNVPKGFSATYSKNGYVFTVTNSSSLAQTGQLVWPIPVLAMAGLFLIVLGSLILTKTRNKNA